MSRTKFTWMQPLATASVLTVALTTAVCASPATSLAEVTALHAVPTNIAGVFAFQPPPAGFDARKATDQELRAWGYPARPGLMEGTAAWERWEAQVSSSLTRVVPYLVRHEGVYHRPASGVSLAPLPSRYNAIAATSSNWSGFAIVPNSGAQPYSSVQGAWVVPAVKQAPGTCSGGWDYSSQWIGIGGFNDAFLLQAGSAADVYCDTVPGADVAEYFPWIEWLPAAETELLKSSTTPFPFAPGDYVLVVVTATNWVSGASTSGTLTFTDYTQGWTVALTYTAASLGGSKVTGQSAEWIVERTQVNGSFATLPDYVAVPWMYAKAQDLGAVAHFPGTPGTGTAYDITMLDNSNANVSFVDLTGANALWFFAEGSATQ